MGPNFMDNDPQRPEGTDTPVPGYLYCARKLVSTPPTAPRRICDPILRLSRVDRPLAHGFCFCRVVGCVLGRRLRPYRRVARCLVRSYDLRLGAVRMRGAGLHGMSDRREKKKKKIIRTGGETVAWRTSVAALPSGRGHTDPAGADLDWRGDQKKEYAAVAALTPIQPSTGTRWGWVFCRCVVAYSPFA